MEYVLETSGLSKQYKHFKALQDCVMHVPKGAIYGFIGKNGAGKTTLIRLICGLQRPSAGTYHLYGISHTDRDIIRSRRRMGAVVETPSIYGEMTAEQNIQEQYRILGLPSFEGILALLETVGLAQTGKKRAKNFSLGMRQRLGIALALAGDPDFLVLDEPINGLDPQGIIEIRELILRLNRERQITFLISSHILDELSRLATHYGFIDKGHIIQEISAQDLENACRKYIQVEVSDTTVLAHVMDAMKIEYEILSPHSARIYHTISVSQLVEALSSQDCQVISLQEQDESLESYYIRLIGGDIHE